MPTTAAMAVLTEAMVSPTEDMVALTVAMEVTEATVVSALTAMARGRLRLLLRLRLTRMPTTEAMEAMADLTEVMVFPTEDMVALMLAMEDTEATVDTALMAMERGRLSLPLLLRPRLMPTTEAMEAMVARTEDMVFPMEDMAALTVATEDTVLMAMARGRLRLPLLRRLRPMLTTEAMEVTVVLMEDTEATGATEAMEDMAALTEATAATATESRGLYQKYWKSNNDHLLLRTQIDNL